MSATKGAADAPMSAGEVVFWWIAVSLGRVAAIVLMWRWFVMPVTGWSTLPWLGAFGLVQFTDMFRRAGVADLLAIDDLTPKTRRLKYVVDFAAVALSLALGFVVHLIQRELAS